MTMHDASFFELRGILAPKPSANSLQPHPEVLPVGWVPEYENPFRSPRRLVHGYFCLYFGLCLQIRPKVMTNCTDDQIKPLTPADLILRELIRQAPTNRSEEHCFVEFNAFFLHRGTGVVSTKVSIEHPVPGSPTLVSGHDPRFP